MLLSVALLDMTNIPVQISTVDLSSNVNLHTLVITDSDVDHNATDSPLSRVLNTIKPGMLKRLMLGLPLSRNDEQEQDLASRVTLLARPQFQSLTHLYFIRDPDWFFLQRRKSLKQERENVKNAFASLVARGVEVRVESAETSREIADRWEQETIAERN